MRTRLLARLNLALCALFLLSACAPAAAPSPTAAPAPPAPTAAPAKAAATAAPAKPAEKAAVRKEGPSFTFKFASTSPEADLSGVGYKQWAKLIDERTGGRIKFQFFWAGSLLSSTQMFQGLRDGLSDFAGPAMSYVSGQVPDVAIFEVPFAYPTEPSEMLAFYKEAEPLLDQIMGQKFNQKLVWASPSTTPDPVSCKGKFLDSEQAWKGALVRTAGKWQSRTLEVWGAKPVVIDLGDAYTAIQRGTADCLLLVYNLLDSFKLYEVVTHITRIDHSINMVAVHANLDTWKKLPPEDQQILVDAGREAQNYLVAQRKDLVVTTIDKFKQAGVKVCTPSQQELKRLRAVTDTVLQEISREQTDAGHKIQDIARKYREAVKVVGPVEGDMTPCPGA
ncbi:MAG: TRAP transporter substrate-binding protein [Chloroflexi bacterium]|nr:TRAP transporter substrate-binding protein [Chloroflexota bacterium]